MQVSVGIFAHNEADTIGQAIDAFLAQQKMIAEIAEILVVCCACTDATVKIASNRAEADNRVRIVERVRREGKVAAINAFLAAASHEIVILSGGDVVPGPHLVELLVRPMRGDALCGMTGAKVVSAAEDPRDLAGILHRLLWQLHHEVARRAPKLGETIAVRRSLLPMCLPPGVYCDEVLIESLIVKRGGQLVYVAEARVCNLPPKNARHLYNQRRRVACQHAASRCSLNYRPSTSRPRNVMVALGAVGRRDRRVWKWLAVLAALETTARLHGHLDFLRGRRYRTWRSVDRCEVSSTQLQTCDVTLTPGRVL